MIRLLHLREILDLFEILMILCNFIEIKLRHGCSPVNLLHIFRTSFPRNTFWWLLLKYLAFSWVATPITSFLEINLSQILVKVITIKLKISLSSF